MKKQGSLIKSLATSHLIPPPEGDDRFESDGIKFRVDTRYVHDVECWETCVFKDDDSGTNVEHYSSAVKATKGHAKWVSSLKAKPRQKLKDQIEYGL